MANGENAPDDATKGATKDGDAATEPADGAEETSATPPGVGPWHVAALGVLMAALLIALALVIPKFNSDRDTVTGILGVVVPAFATIGAALFGVTVGYSAGAAQGETTGKAKGEANKDAAVTQALGAVHANASDAQEAMDAIVKGITTHLNSPAGSNAFLAPDGNPVVETPQLARAREKMSAVMEATRPRP
jgi:hypothetical protein